MKQYTNGNQLIMVMHLSIAHLNTDFGLPSTTTGKLLAPANPTQAAAPHNTSCATAESGILRDATTSSSVAVTGTCSSSGRHGEVLIVGTILGILIALLCTGLVLTILAWVCSTRKRNTSIKYEMIMSVK